MTDNILEKVKSALHISGTFQDDALRIYIDEVKQFLLDGGVNENVVESRYSVGVIVRGVIDLWNYGSGGTDYSEAFLKRAYQLKDKVIEDVQTTE